jgi:hypothetical protein
MYLIMADEVEEFQVVKPVILAIAVFVMDFCLIIHGEEELAVRTSSTLMFQEFSSGCVQSDVRSFACAPVAPVAIIRAYAFAQSSLSFDWGLDVPSQRPLFPDDIVLAPASWFEIFLYDPLGAFMSVPPFCPASYLPPEAWRQNTFPIHEPLHSWGGSSTLRGQPHPFPEELAGVRSPHGV